MSEEEWDVKPNKQTHKQKKTHSKTNIRTMNTVRAVYAHLTNQSVLEANKLHY